MFNCEFLCLYAYMKVKYNRAYIMFFYRWFEKYSEPDFARAGNVSTQTVMIEEGPLSSFSHSMEPQLRKLGLPTSLQKGMLL